MSGSTIVGKRGSRNAESLITAETRQLSKLLKQLRDPEQAASVLQACCSSSNLNLGDDLLNASLRKRRLNGGKNSTELYMAQSVQRAFEAKQQQKRSTVKRSLVVAREEDASSLIMTTTTSVLESLNTPAASSNEKEPTSSSSSPLMTTTTTPEPTVATKAVTPLISDSEGGAVDESVAGPATTTAVEQELAVMDFWAHLLERIHLYIASLPSSTTTIPITKKFKYQVYRLAGPVMPVSENTTREVCRRIRKEFLTWYDGSTPSSSSTSSTAVLRYSECRVYAVLREESLWVQLNIGRCTDFTTEEKQQQHQKNEFVAVIVPESNVVALATTGSSAASHSRFTPYVLSALESALTCSVAGGYQAKDVYAQQLVDLSGADPRELLRSAHAVESSTAVGRFAGYASAGNTRNPIEELHFAATSCLVPRGQETKRPEASSQHGGSFVSPSVRAGLQSGDVLVATNPAGTRTLVNQSSSSELVEHDSRKRIRFDEGFGCDDKDMPVRTCVRWDWKGKTTAAAAAWQKDDDNDDDGSDAAQQQEKQLPTHKFKCRVVMQGPDVFAGLRSLMAAGLMKDPLPHYVKDAASMGEGGIINVDHGAVQFRANKHSS